MPQPQSFPDAGEPHFKVANAALDAVQTCLQHHASLFEVSLDRLLPLLAQRIIDPKEAIRMAAAGYAAASLLCVCSTVQLFCVVSAVLLPSGLLYKQPISANSVAQNAVVYFILPLQSCCHFGPPCV